MNVDVIIMSELRRAHSLLYSRLWINQKEGAHLMPSEVKDIGDVLTRAHEYIRELEGRPDNEQRP